MAVRKPVNDPEALLAATDLFTETLRGITITGPDDEGPIGEDLTRAFRFAEFETVTTRVAGEDITMRRLVLTTEWAVQTD
jgi:hypothetical protein